MRYDSVVVVLLIAIRRKSFAEGTCFEEKRGQSAQVLPSSVRLVKFEKAMPQVEEASTHEQEQDVKAV